MQGSYVRSGSYYFALLMTHHYYHHSHYITHGQSMNSFEWPNKATKMVRGGSFFLQILSRNKSHREIGGVAKTKPCPSFWQRPLYNRLNCQHLSSTSPSSFTPSSTSPSIYSSTTSSGMIKSLFVVYCNIMFHVAEAKIIRHINKALYDETLAHFSVPKRKSAGKKGSIGLVRYTTMNGPKQYSRTFLEQ